MMIGTIVHILLLWMIITFELMSLLWMIITCVHMSVLWMHGTGVVDDWYLCTHATILNDCYL